MTRVAAIAIHVFNACAALVLLVGSAGGGRAVAEPVGAVAEAVRAAPAAAESGKGADRKATGSDRKSTRLNSSH